MNYIKHLSGFFEKISNDERLNPSHVSLYVSLFQFWNACRFHNPISISRNEVMRISKIYSKATYHKCIRELNDFGYLSYQPSYNPFKGSLVYLFDFGTGSKQVLATKHTKKQTSSKQVVVPYTNSTNNNKQQTELKEGISIKKNNSIKLDSKDENGTPPSSIEVQVFFLQSGSSTEQAEIFFNHFESNGWLVGGKSPMKNWQAAAKKWMLNSKNFNPVKTLSAGKLHATTGKDYNEPL